MGIRREIEKAMGDLIRLTNRKARGEATLTPSGPWEFRWARWETPYFVQMLRSQAERLDAGCQGSEQGVCERVWQLPPHHVLKGGLECTIQTLFAHRDRPERMREAYYLFGLMDCLVNQVNPVLRTDLLHVMVKKVFEMRSRLGIRWVGHLDRVLLPIDTHLFSEDSYRAMLAAAGSLKALDAAIREGTETMFALLGAEYVFYCPKGRA